jgi:D-alanyl-D-alanine carboxypeptidase/D-alanyl-D-alanine-endopeptidase (penicillin-binding protein 4)
MLANWLVSLYRDSATRDEFVASLPQAGEEGTLKRRFQGTSLKSDVRAKTGYLTGVSAISGYITSTETGRKLVFSIITNDKPNKVALSTIRALEEKIVLLGDEWVSGSKERAPGGR